MTNKNIDWTKSAKDFFAGSIAGMTSLVVCYPMDIVRTRLQTAPSGKFTGVGHTFSNTIRTEGFRALYKGMASPLLAQGLQKAIMFGVYGTTLRYINQHNKKDDIIQLSFLYNVYIAGATAGLVNTSIAVPIELIRNKLMVQYEKNRTLSKYKGPIDCAIQIVKELGFKGLWKGFRSTLIRDVPGVGAWFTCFEGTKQILLSSSSSSSSSSSIQAWKLIVAGAMGGIGYWATAFPQDTIKSLIQTDTTGKYRGVLQTATTLIKEEGGVSRLYRGFSMGLYRGVPGAAVVFTTHAFVLKLLINY